MLIHTGILTKDEGEQIIAGLEALQEKLAKNELTFTIENEDIHLNMETFLHQEIGPVAGKLHTARSRNDQVATDMHLYLKEVLTEVVAKIHHFREVLVEKRKNIENHRARLHSPSACPTDFFWHHLMAYYQMLTRVMNNALLKICNVQIFHHLGLRL